VRLLFQQEAIGSRDGAVQEMHGGEPEEGQGAIPDKGDTMSEVKIKVPEGMLQAGRAAYSGYVTAEEGSRRILEAAIRWMAENPIVPKTYDELPTIGYMSDSSAWGTKGTPEYEQKRQENYFDGMIRFLSEWQRRMFLAPGPEVPEAVKDLMDPLDPYPYKSLHNPGIIEAYRRGQKSVSGAS
jgi:hypothetical protein